MADGWVGDEAQAADWLLGLLGASFATLDLPVLARLIGAWRADDPDAVARWSTWLLACRPTQETRAEDRQLGAALARVLVAVGIDEAAAWHTRPQLTHAALFALGAARFAIPLPDALAGYAFSWAEAVTSAAVRLVPLGQNAGQRLLLAAGAAVRDAVPARCAWRSVTTSWARRRRARRWPARATRRFTAGCFDHEETNPMRHIR